MPDFAAATIETAHYERRDTVSGTLLTTFATVLDLAAWLRDYAAINGAGAVAALSLLHVDRQGIPALFADGTALLNHLTYAAPPATETPA